MKLRDWRFRPDYGPQPSSISGMDELLVGRVDGDRRYLGEGNWQSINTHNKDPYRKNDVW